MKRWMKAVALLCWIALPLGAEAQVAVQANPDHEKLLHSSDPCLAANKHLVYDFWREVLEAGHMDEAPKYLAESYIQHNPNVPSGRAAFVAFFSKVVKEKDVQPRIQAPLVAIVAEGDLVVLSFVSRHSDPKHASQKYTTTWFDMFRVENGKIVEHWDPDVKE